MLRTQFDDLLTLLAPEAVSDPSRSFAKSDVDPLGVVKILIAVEDAFDIRFTEDTIRDGAAYSPDALFEAVVALRFASSRMMR